MISPVELGNSLKPTGGWKIKKRGSRDLARIVIVPPRTHLVTPELKYSLPVSSKCDGLGNCGHWGTLLVKLRNARIVDWVIWGLWGKESSFISVHSLSDDDDLGVLKIIGISQGSEYLLISLRPVYLVAKMTSVGAPANRQLTHLWAFSAFPVQNQCNRFLHCKPIEWGIRCVFKNLYSQAQLDASLLFEARVRSRIGVSGCPRSDRTVQNLERDIVLERS